MGWDLFGSRGSAREANCRHFLFGATENLIYSRIPKQCAHFHIEEMLLLKQESKHPHTGH
jgi:hypothetical protein